MGSEAGHVARKLREGALFIIEHLLGADLCLHREHLQLSLDFSRFESRSTSAQSLIVMEDLHERTSDCRGGS